MRLSNVPVVPAAAGGATDALRDELARLHEGWMALVFPRQRTSPDSVLGKWRPGTALGRLKYGLWGALGLPVVGLLYVVALVGSPLRSVARRVGGVADTWGLLGVVWSAAFVGAAASGVAWLWASRTAFLAVLVAAGLGTVAASLAMTLARVRGRATTVLLAYPLGVVAVVLLPLAAATYATPVPELYLGRTLELLPARFEAALGTYAEVGPDVAGSPDVVVAAWAGLAALAGWLAGALVALTDLARPVDG